MAGKVLEVKGQLDKSLREAGKPWTKLFDEMENKTGIDRTYLFMGGLAALVLWLMFGFAGQLVCNSVGFLYPAYESIKAIESRKKEDDTKWLTYWVVFAIFSLVEFFADIIVGWFPLYWLVKCVFMVWLMVPSANLNGSIILYERLVRPYFLKHQSFVEETINTVKKSATVFASKDD